MTNFKIGDVVRINDTDGIYSIFDTQAEKMVLKKWF